MRYFIAVMLHSVAGSNLRGHHLKNTLILQQFTRLLSFEAVFNIVNHIPMQQLHIYTLKSMI